MFPYRAKMAPFWGFNYSLNNGFRNSWASAGEIGRESIPNMTNWSKREAIFLLDKLNIKYTLTGNGYVKSQSIKENTPLTPELEINLILENKDTKKEEKVLK